MLLLIYFSRFYYCGLKDSTVGSVFTLHAADLDLIPNNLYGPKSTKSIPDYGQKKQKYFYYE